MKFLYSNYYLDREKVNEFVVTHWFQNKRKLLKLSNKRKQILEKLHFLVFNI